MTPQPNQPGHGLGCIHVILDNQHPQRSRLPGLNRRAVLSFPKGLIEMTAIYVLCAGALLLRINHGTYLLSNRKIKRPTLRIANYAALGKRRSRAALAAQTSATFI